MSSAISSRSPFAASTKATKSCLRAEVGVDGVVPAVGRPMPHGEPGSFGPASSVLFGPLRFVRPIGWIGGR